MRYELLFAPVLIVDDDPLMLRQLTASLRGLGFSDVRPAIHFERGLEILEAAPVSLLICDIELPDGDGRRLALKALSLHPKTLIVLISGFPAHSLMIPEELRTRAHFLEKPFELEELRLVLNAMGEEFSTLKRIPA